VPIQCTIQGLTLHSFNRPEIQAYCNGRAEWGILGLPFRRNKEVGWPERLADGCGQETVDVEQALYIVKR